MLYDAVLTDFTRFPDETDDAPRIQRAIDAAAGGVLFIPKGLYEVASPLVIGSYTSIELHPSAVIRAVKELDYIISFDGSKQTRADDGIDTKHMLNMYIKGGVFDANGLGNCMHIEKVRHFTLSDMTLANPKQVGLMTGEGGCELIVNNLYVHSDMLGLAGNIGLCVKMGDSHFTDCIVVDCTVGFDIWGGSSRFTRCHVWGGPVKRDKEKNISEYLPGSVGFRVNYAAGNEHTLRECYADTSEVGFEIHDKTRLLACAYLNNPIFNLDSITVIDHQWGAYLSVEDCFFRIVGENGIMYKGENKNIHWGENRFEGGSEYTADGKKK